MSDLTQQLESHPFLRGMSRDHVARLAKHAREVSFPKGALVFREGGEADTFYLVTTGTIALETYVPARGVIQLESLREGDILGLHWLFPPRRWVLNAVASEPVRAIAIDADGLRKTLDADPAVGYEVTKRLLQQLYLRLGRVRLQRLDVYRSAP